MSKVLICTPTAKPKDYAIERFANACRAFTYPERHHLVVDNTNDDGEHAKYLQEFDFAEVVADPINPALLVLVITQMWENFFIPYAHEHGYEYILSLESDIIAPPDVIEILMHGVVHYNAAICGHAYGRRRNPQQYPLKYERGLIRQSLGCTLFRTDLIEPGENCLDYFEVYLWEKARLANLPMVHLENVIETEHMWSPQSPYQYSEQLTNTDPNQLLTDPEEGEEDTHDCSCCRPNA